MAYLHRGQTDSRAAPNKITELDKIMFRTLFAVAAVSATLVTPAFAEENAETIANHVAEQAQTANAIADKTVASINKDDILSFLVIPDVSQSAQTAAADVETETLLVSLEDKNTAG